MIVDPPAAGDALAAGDASATGDALPASDASATAFSCASSQPGDLHLCVGRVDGASAATSFGARNPSRLLVPQPRGEAVWAYATSFGGGLVAGDSLSQRVRVENGSRCYLTTQASTKVYKSPGARGGNVIEPLAARDGKVSSQTTTASVATNGLLVFAPAHVAAFAGARFENANAFYLQEGANLVAVDALAAGRIEPANERWQFSRATSATEVFFRDQLAYRDAYDLQPIPGLPTPAQLLADMNFQSTVLIIGPALRSLVETATSLTQQTGGLLVSASSLLRLPDSMPGCVVRVLATEVAAGNACIETLLAPALVPLLGGNPWRRTF